MPPTKKTSPAEPVEPEVPTVPVVPADEDVERIPPEPIIPGVTEQERVDLIEAAERGEVELAPVAEVPFISAGVASDLEMQGWAGDPATGGIFRKDAETGEITFTPRA
jgi:hypothetical protein